MEFLSDTTWDVVICGTGIRQSLLALALSRSGKKILHIDRNQYYGGTEAAFSLQDASTWMYNSQNVSHPKLTIEPICVWTNAHSDKLGSSRSYTLTLSPHLIYSQSALLPAIVSSRLHTQLDFQAVGTWWIYHHASQDASAREGRNVAETNSQDVQGVPVRHINGTLQKIPSNREDVFADDTLSQRDKRSLMKFLRSVLAEPAVEAESNLDIPLSSALTSQFGLAPFLHQPLLALSLSYDSAKAIRTQTVAPRIRRHMRSIGAFGVGFGAVLPKYGGGGEIAQVACRASAVGGAVYVLGRGLKKVIGLDEESPKAQAGQEELVASELSDGEKITSRFVVGCGEDFPADVTGELATDLNGSPVNTVHSISVVSSPLEHLFPPTSENGPVPAGAVVVYTDHDHKTPSQSGSISEDVPTYMVIHSSDSGECPPGQCVIYASTSSTPEHHDDEDVQRLNLAVTSILDVSVLACSKPEVLWTMTYRSKGRSIDSQAAPIQSLMSGRVMIFPPPSIDLAFDDSILESVKEMWKQIMGDEIEHAEFLRFEERRAGDDDA